MQPMGDTKRRQVGDVERHLHATYFLFEIKLWIWRQVRSLTVAGAQVGVEKKQFCAQRWPQLLNLFAPRG